MREIEDDQRRVEVDPGRRGAVEHAAQVAVDEAVEHEGDIQSPGADVLSIDVHRLRGLLHRVTQAFDDVGEDRLAISDRVVDVCVRDFERESGAFVQPTAHGDFDDRTQQSELPGGGDRRVERVEFVAAVEGGHRVEADRRYPELLGDEVPFADAVLALCVKDDDLAVAEAELAQHIGLFQRGLAIAGFAEYQPVRGGELLAVELERVVDVALAGVHLAADDHAGVAQPRCRGGQVDGLRLAGGGAYGQAGRFDLAEQEAGEGVGEGGERIQHGHDAASVSGGCRSRTAGC